MNTSSNLFRELTVSEIDAVLAAHLEIDEYHATISSAGYPMFCGEKGTSLPGSGPPLGRCAGPSAQSLGFAVSLG